MDECKDGQCSDTSVCFKHKLRSIQIAPSAMPSRRNSVAPRSLGEGNSWEKGIATDERGMPLIGKNGYIGLKELQNRRHEIETQLREMKNTPTSNPTS